MDALSGILGGFIKEPIQKYLIAPIKRHISYAFKSDALVKKLREEAELLKGKSDRLQHAVADAKRQGPVEIYPNFSNWLTKTEDAIREPLIDGEEEVKKKCFMGFFPNLKTRHQVGKKAYKKRLVLNELRNKEELEPPCYPVAPKQIVAPYSVFAREALPSRVSLLKDVMDAVNDPHLNMIGVFGMGGVGKTTLALEVQRQAQDNLFDYVIFVAVSSAQTIETIQSVIAKVLGLNLNAEDPLIRANKICEWLKEEMEKNEKTVLIILDDMWSPLELHRVGIPSRDNHKGCKIFVTSRSMDVCRRMGAQKYFQINTLPEDEAWRLFKTILDRDIDNELQLQPIAQKISKKCAELPLLIEIVAKDLQNIEEVYVWETKLNQLSHFDDLNAKVSSVLRSSYDKLDNDETKFFLLCGLFGQSNIPIGCLVKYSAGLKLFKRAPTIRDTRNKILTLIDILKAKSLLLDGDMVGFVKMHDLIRDTARLILSKEQHAFIGMAGEELEEWPDSECTRISLPYCKVNGTLESLDCPNAELLLLSTEDRSLKIPDSFFQEIKNLKVLDFSGLRSLPLPSSLSSLSNLNTLCLHQCKFDNIAIIGELKQLWVLSLVGSTIVELPKEIEQLTRLKSLDLTNCSGIEFIPANMLSKLCLLEELYLKKCCILKGAKGDQILDELSNLSHLTSLEIHVVDIMMIPEALANRLQRYKILIGNYLDWNQWGQDSSCLLKHYPRNDEQRGDGVKLLLQKAEEADLKGVLPDLFDGDDFPHLKRLTVSSSHELPSLINSATKPMFPKLENLLIYDLENLGEFCRGLLPDGSLKELKTLEVRSCPRLKHLFCSDLGEFVPDASHFSKMVVFPNLESLTLWNLEKLNNIWHNEMALNSFFKLKEVDIRECRRLTKIFPSHVIQSFQNLQKLMVEDCDTVEVIFEIEEENNVIFPNLETLELLGLEKLNNIRHNEMAFNSFFKLKEIKIEGCGRLTKIFPSHVIQSF